MVEPPTWPARPPVAPDPSIGGTPPPPLAYNPQPPPPLPGAAARPPTGQKERPWWGLGDALLAIPFIISLSIVGAVLGLIVAAVSGDSFTLDLESADLGLDELSDPALMPPALLVLSALAQQAGQAVWPWIVTKWKGISMAVDWRLRFKPIDLVIGIVVGGVGVVLASLASIGMERLIGLEDPSEADNTDILTNAEGTPWLWAILVIVIIGAPISEELLFRGLVLRAFENRWGPVIAIMGSTITFTLVHFTGAGLGATIVLFTSIGLVGAILGILTLRTDRLAPAIIAHVVFNTVGSIAALTS